MKNIFQIPINDEYQKESEKFVDVLMKDKEAQKKYVEESSEFRTPELRVLNWMNDELLLKSIKEKDAKAISNLLFLQNNFVKDIYLSEESEKKEPTPRGVLAVAAYGVAGILAVAAALYTEVVSVSNRYMTATTKFWGAGRSTMLTKLSFNGDQKSLITALSVLADVQLVGEAIDCYGQLLEEFGGKVVNSNSLNQKLEISL